MLAGKTLAALPRLWQLQLQRWLLLLWHLQACSLRLRAKAPPRLQKHFDLRLPRFRLPEP